MTADRDMVPPDFVREAYQKRLPADEASALDLLFALRACVQRVNANLQRWMGAEAVTPGRMQMMMVLWAHDGPVRQADLSALLHVSRPSVSELVEALEREDLAARQADPGHRLRFLVSLTETGQREAQKLLQEHSARLCTTFPMHAAARHKLARTLDQVVLVAAENCKRGGRSGLSPVTPPTPQKNYPDCQSEG